MEAQSGPFAGGIATQLEDGIWAIDLGFQGWDQVVYAYLLASPSELALIETGPTATLSALRAGVTAAGFDLTQLTRIFVSHIHLDHAGAAGAIVRDLPDVQVFVHPLGAPHLVDPSRLVSSAARLYGDRMDALWGGSCRCREPCRPLDRCRDGRCRGSRAERALYARPCLPSHRLLGA